MPELPEVETVCRGLRPVLEGRRLAGVHLARAGLRKPFPDRFAESLTGRTVTAIRRRAKYFLWDLDDGHTVVGHLGMSGTIEVTPPGHPVPNGGPHDHVILVLDSGARLVFRDPRRFGQLDLCRREELAAYPGLRGLGPEPLDDAFDGAALHAALARKRGPVKPVLMDQTVVAGIGNIYACEALFRAGIDPTRPALSLAAAEVTALAAAVKAVLGEAIESGGSSLRDHRLVNGDLGYFQHAFAVYDRAGQPCPGCTCESAITGGIRRLVQGGRSTFFCPTRQR